MGHPIDVAGADKRHPIARATLAGERRQHPGGVAPKISDGKPGCGTDQLGIKIGGGTAHQRSFARAINIEEKHRIAQGERGKGEFGFPNRAAAEPVRLENHQQAPLRPTAQAGKQGADFGGMMLRAVLDHQWRRRRQEGSIAGAARPGNRPTSR